MDVAGFTSSSSFASSPPIFTKHTKHTHTLSLSLSLSLLPSFLGAKVPCKLVQTNHDSFPMSGKEGI